MPPRSAEVNGYHGNGWFWKPIAIFLMGALLTGASMMFREHVMLRGFCTKAEAKEMVKNAPYPWIQDRKYVLETLSDIKNKVSNIERKVWSHESRNP